MCSSADHPGGYRETFVYCSETFRRGQIPQFYSRLHRRQWVKILRAITDNENNPFEYGIVYTSIVVIAF